MGNSLAVQWLGLCAFTADSLGSIPVREQRSHKPHNVAKIIIIIIIATLRMDFLIKKEQTCYWTYILTIRITDGNVEFPLLLKHTYRKSSPEGRELPLFLVPTNW